MLESAAEAPDPFGLDDHYRYGIAKQNHNDCQRCKQGAISASHGQGVDMPILYSDGEIVEVCRSVNHLIGRCSHFPIGIADWKRPLKNRLFQQFIPFWGSYGFLLSFETTPFRGQPPTNVSTAYSRSFSPEIRYFFLPYTKYASEKLPFSSAKSLAECSPPIYAVLP